MEIPGLPSAFVDKLRTVYPQRIDDVLASYQAPRPISIRVNTIKTSREALITRFHDRDITLLPVAWYDHAFIVPARSARDLTELEEYKTGWFYIQNLSSMAAPLILDARPGERVLDLAAAPGSKTTQIAAMMNNTGTIVANDISRDRIYKLQANLVRYGVTNTETTSGAAELFWRRYPESFDRVLLDAPCSMEGTFSPSSTDESDWSQKNVKRLAKRQRWMLRSAISAAKRGGLIVYSTCTVSPEENEEVIDWILEKEGDAIELESATIPHLESMTGLTAWNGNRYNDQVSMTTRIPPGRQMEGFYIARIRKLTSTVPASASQE